VLAGVDREGFEGGVSVGGQLFACKEEWVGKHQICML